jgi:hypothetical protein
MAEPPPGLDEFEADIMAPDALKLYTLDRAFIRAPLRYVRLLERRLERDVAEMGSFW